jgi:hypothetical protein
VQAYISKGIEEGATLVIGGSGKPEGLTTGHFARPTIFANVGNDMTIAQEEIFGTLAQTRHSRDSPERPLRSIPSTDSTTAVSQVREAPGTGTVPRRTGVPL